MSTSSKALPRIPHPIPNITQLFLYIADITAPLISPSLLASYLDAIKKPAILSAAQSILPTLSSSETNWAAAWFENLLLHTRYPVANTQRMSTLLGLPSQSMTQARAVAEVLRAVGVWCTEYVAVGETGERYTDMQRAVDWQLKGLCGGFRVPVSEEKDELVQAEMEAGKGWRAVVWYQGVAWEVEVIAEDGRVLAVQVIEEQIMDIVKTVKEAKDNVANIPRIAAASWRLHRKEWLREKTVLEAVSGNKELFKALYSSLVTVAIEDYPSPPDTAECLNDIRMGATSENRFADQTFGIISYLDGRIGLTFDHAPADCGAAMELSQIIMDIIRSSVGTSPVSSKTTIKPPTPLRFQGAKPQLPMILVEPMPRKVVTIDILNGVGTPRIHVLHRLTDTVVGLALQTVVMEIYGKPLPMFQPVFQKKFHRGRVTPICPVTEQSVAFISLLNSTHPPSELLSAFEAVITRRRELIRIAQSGYISGHFIHGYLYPYFEQLSKKDDSEDLETVLQVLRPLAGQAARDFISSIQLTGFTAPTTDVEAGLSNIYLPNQLVLFYLQKPGGIMTVCFNATGGYIKLLEGIAEKFREWYGRIAKVADEYAQQVR